MADHLQFRDFDQADNFRNFHTQVRSFDSKNFVLEFNGAEARCAFDIGTEGFAALLAQRSKPVDSQAPNSAINTRWINIWKPETQQGTLEAIGKEYGFSPRLLLSMCSRPGKRMAAVRPAHQHRNYQDYLPMPRNRKPGNSIQATTPSTSSRRDVESAGTPGQAPSTSPVDINHYKIVSEVWHFASIDWGHRFTCIGFNSIYQTTGQTMLPDMQPQSNKPAGKRVWAWLVLCNDNTVISIHENPFPDGRAHTNKELYSIRHNLLNVFKQLSKINDSEDPTNPIMTVHIRPGLQHAHEGETRISDKDSPSLLFYYLFDDWYTTYALVARSEHQYGAHLERTREKMFQVADIKNINELHHFGRQLAVLKRIYQSYIMLIERMLRGPQAAKYQRDEDDNFQGTGELDVASSTMLNPKLAYGVMLPTSVSVRFERLRDRITLYALNEIQDCLDEKEALVMLNFNLIALRESSYVERLTRITILLAKVTILFIPVSLMSTYFTVPIPGVSENYTLATYWGAFAVILFISFLALVVFGQLSGTQEGRPVYRSLSRAGIEAWKTFFRRRERDIAEKGDDEDFESS